MNEDLQRQFEVSKDLPKSFEEALSALEQTVHQLESGGLTLDEATRLYESGIRLARFCNERIAAAELKITEIKSAYGDQMRLLGEEDSVDDCVDEDNSVSAS